MNPFLKWYLIGMLIALIINLIFMVASHKVKVSNVLGYILNTALSWGCLLSLLIQWLVNILEQRHWNKVLWTSAEYKRQQKQIEDMHRAKNPRLNNSRHA